MATTYAGTKGRIRKVTTSPLSILGEGTWWLASRPGGVYLVGDGLHFYRWADAVTYASGRAESEEP